MITNFVFSPSHSLLTTSLLVQIIRGVELLAIKDQIYSQVLKDIAHLLPLTLACLCVLPAETNTKIMCITNFVFSPSHSLLTISLLVLIIRGVELLAIKEQIYFLIDPPPDGYCNLLVCLCVCACACVCVCVCVCVHACAHTHMSMCSSVISYFIKIIQFCKSRLNTVIFLHKWSDL